MVYGVQDWCSKEKPDQPVWYNVQGLGQVPEFTIKWLIFKSRSSQWKSFHWLMRNGVNQVTQSSLKSDYKCIHKFAPHMTSLTSRSRKNLINRNSGITVKMNQKEISLITTQTLANPASELNHHNKNCGKITEGGSDQVRHTAWFDRHQNSIYWVRVRLLSAFLIG